MALVTLNYKKVAPTGYIMNKREQEIHWQESELLKADAMLQADRPNAQAILDYRAELRAYNNHIDFPDGERPTL